MLIRERDVRNVGAAARDAARRRELDRCRRSLWYLATKKLGYGWNPGASAGKGGFITGKGLTERLHRPICQWYDAHREDPFVGLWMSRWFHKSTLVVCMSIQDWLIDPLTALLYWHAIEDEAQKVCAEVGHHVLHNKKLRALDPVGEYRDADGRIQRYNIFPARNNKRAVKADRVVLRRPDGLTDDPALGAIGVRRLSLLARGAGSELTGAHGNKAYLDDVIGRQDIEDNQLPKKKDWYENTVLPVVDDAMIRVTGTPWSDWGMYQDWIEDPDWVTLEIPAASIDRLEDVDWTKRKIRLRPDYELADPLYGDEEAAPRVRRKLQMLKRQMKGNFGPQMMVDPTPAADLLWDTATCERACGLEPTASAPGLLCPGTFFVLSDPAPAKIGSLRGDTEKLRADGTKDDWAIATVKLALWNGLQVGILAELRTSADWPESEGYDEACRQMKRWGTSLLFNEAYGMGVNIDGPAIREAAIRMGVRLYTMGKNALPRFRDSYMAGAKRYRFGRLCDWARSGRFWYCSETVDREELEKLWSQARRCVFRENGRSSLRHDDSVDVVSRITDSGLQDLAPHDQVGSADDSSYGSAVVGAVLASRRRSAPRLRYRYMGI